MYVTLAWMGDESNTLPAHEHGISLTQWGFKAAFVNRGFLHEQVRHSQQYSSTHICVNLMKSIQVKQF